MEDLRSFAEVVELCYYHLILVAYWLGGECGFGWTFFIV